MKRELLILRHAKSSWADESLADYDRPLKRRGKNDALKMGRFLKKQHLLPDLILCSSARRAVETVKGLLGQLPQGQRPGRLTYRQSLYLADGLSLLDLLRQVAPGCRRLLLVGHNPGLEELLHYLAEESIDLPVDGKLLPTATLAHFEIRQAWEKTTENTSRLIGLTRPKSLINEFV